MPNLFDCPREMRDMIYSAYFTKLVADSPYCRMQDEKIVYIDHPIGAEAMQIALAFVDKAIASSKADLAGTDRAWKEVEDKSRKPEVRLSFTADDRELRRKRLDLANQIQRQEEAAVALRKRAKLPMEKGSQTRQSCQKVCKKPKAGRDRDDRGVRNFSKRVCRHEDDEDDEDVY